MKKTLCLILAFVFVLGLCTVGAGAAFSDAADVQYTEAVDTMANLGILIGFEDGSFKPTENVTRAQAAKLIAYMMLGKENAEKMPAKQVFEDVPATNWAAKYVNYCATKGIINGLGNGKFAPNDNVTAIQLAKMLLAAAGYGKNGEFVGSGWDVNVFMLALDKGVLADSAAADFSAPATREEAALYVYNTMMDVELVNYSKLLDDYSGTGEDFATKVWGFEEDFGVLTANEANTANFAGKSTINDTDFEISTTAADLGKYYKVQYKIDKDGKNVVYGLTELSTAMTGKEAVAAKVAAAKVPQFVNGKVATTDDTVTPAATSEGTFIVKDGKLVAYIGVDTVTYGTLKVTAASKTTPATYQVKVKVGTATNLVTVLGAEEIKDGDVVSVKCVGEFAYAYAMTVEENVKITKKQALADGKSYKYNGGAFTFANVSDLDETAKVQGVTVNVLKKQGVLDLGGTYNLYKDVDGKVCGYSLPTVAPVSVDYSEYVMVTAVYDGSSVNEHGQPSYFQYVQCVDADGDIIYYTIAADAAKPTVKNIYSVKESAKAGYYTFTAAAETLATSTSFFTASAKLTVADTANVISVSIPATGTDAEKAAKVTAKVLKTLTNGSQAVYTYKVVPSGTTKITTIQTAWVLTEGTGSAPKGDGYVYLTKAQTDNLGLAEESINEAGKTVKTYKGYQNGELVDMTYIYDADKATYTNFSVDNFKEGFHQYRVNANGEFVLEEKVKDPKNLEKGNFDIFGGKLYVDDNTYALDGVKIVDITAGKTANLVADVDALIDAVNDTGTPVTLKFMVSADGKTIAGNVIYVDTAPAK